MATCNGHVTDANPHSSINREVSRHGRNTQPEWIGMHAKQGKKDYEQKERTHRTSQATKTQPLILTTDTPFVAALETIPTDDWCRTWVAGRTIWQDEDTMQTGMNLPEIQFSMSFHTLVVAVM